MIGDWVLFSEDAALGRRVWARENEKGGLDFNTQYYAQETVDINTEQRNMAMKGWGGDYHHIASIPLNIVHEQLVEAQNQGDDAYVSKWLNDSDNSKWRTKSGRV